MKAFIIQPPYSRDTSRSDEFFQYKLNMLDSCDESADIIVLPEYSDVPCATGTLEETLFYHEKYVDILLNKCIETAKRCNSLVFVNALSYLAYYINRFVIFGKWGEFQTKHVALSIKCLG